MKATDVNYLSNHRAKPRNNARLQETTHNRAQPRETGGTRLSGPTVAGTTMSRVRQARSGDFRRDISAIAGGAPGKSRNAHSRPDRAIHRGARAYLPARKSSPGPDAKRHRGPHRIDRTADPELLLGRPQPDQNQVRPRRAGSGDRVAGDVRTVAPNQAVIAPDDAGCLRSTVSNLCRGLRNAWRAAQQIDPPMTPAQPAQARGTRRSEPVTLSGQRTPQQPRNPHERHPVGKRKARALVRVSEILVGFSL